MTDIPKKLSEILEKYLNADKIIDMVAEEYIIYNSAEKRAERRHNCLIEILNNQHINDNSIIYWNLMKKILDEDQQRKVLRLCFKSPIEVTFMSGKPKFFIFFYDVCDNLFSPDEVRRFMLGATKIEPSADMLIFKEFPMVYKILLNTSLDDARIIDPGELTKCLERTNFYLDLMRKSMTDEEISLLEAIISNAEEKIAELEQ